MRVRFGSRRAGIGLLHTMVYLSVVALILMVGLMGFYRCQTQSLQLQRNTQDIGRALHAGELWREEVRASATAEMIEDGPMKLLRLGDGEKETLYAFANERMWRRAPGETNWTPFLNGVKGSEMLVEMRGEVEVCRWELELATEQKTVRLKPLFTFMAAPGR